ncbi:DcrB-related protein [Dermacoccaceae bacterium W4C1]
MPGRRLHLWMCAPLLAGLLTGCAASADPDATTTAAPELPTTLEAQDGSALQTEAADGAVPARDRSFSTTVPSGWSDVTADHSDTLLFLRDDTAKDRVNPSFTVTTASLKTEVALNELVEQGMIAQRQKGATVTKLGDTTIGGVPAAGYRLTTTKDEVPVTQMQFYAVRGRTVYITTVTAAESDAKGAQSAQDTILSSWSWGAEGVPAATRTRSSPSSSPSSTASSSSTPTSSSASSPASSSSEGSTSDKEKQSSSATRSKSPGSAASTSSAAHRSDSSRSQSSSPGFAGSGD